MRTQRVGDGTHLLVCKKVNAGQIAAHDVAVRSIGAELDSYGVIVRYEQRATNVKECERKRTDMELWFDGRSVAVDYTVPNTLNPQAENSWSQIRTPRSAV